MIVSGRSGAEGSGAHSSRGRAGSLGRTTWSSYRPSTHPQVVGSMSVWSGTPSAFTSSESMSSLLKKCRVCAGVRFE